MQLALTVRQCRRHSWNDSTGSLGVIVDLLPDILKSMSAGQRLMFASVNKWAFLLVNGHRRQLFVGSYARGGPLLHAPSLYHFQNNTRIDNGAAKNRKFEPRVNLAEYLSSSSTLSLERVLRCDRYSKAYLLLLVQVYANPRLMRALVETRGIRPPLHSFSLGYLASTEAIEDDSEMREAAFVVYRWCLQSDVPATMVASGGGDDGEPPSERELALRSRNDVLEEVAHRILAVAPAHRSLYNLEMERDDFDNDPLLQMFVVIGARGTKALTIFEVVRRAVMPTTTMTSRDFATAAFIGACSSANFEVISVLRDRYHLSNLPQPTDFDFVTRAAKMLLAADLNFAETTSTLRLLWNLTRTTEVIEEGGERVALADSLLTSTLLTSASPSVILWYSANLRISLRWGDHRSLLRNLKLLFGERSDELMDELWRRLVIDVGDGDRRIERFRDVIALMPNMTTLNRFLQSWIRLNKLEKLPDAESVAGLNRLRDLMVSHSRRDADFCRFDAAGAHEYGFFEGEAFEEFRRLFDLLAVERVLGIEHASHLDFASRLRHPRSLQIAETISLDAMLEKLAGTVRDARSGRYLFLIAPELAAFLRTHRERSEPSNRHHRGLSFLRSIDKSNVPSFPVRHAENPTAGREYANFDVHAHRRYLEALFEFADRVHDEVLRHKSFESIANDIIKSVDGSDSETNIADVSDFGMNVADGSDSGMSDFDPRKWQDANPDDLADMLDKNTL
ncbi:hypothetical protein CYMTET_9848 [Cymbomonas tetramitiformis]|uniref:Uncharacterized protein n=1 Tax=Cymbomonas tetramitiformis TaxID=36881 RepID=A0AAE0GQM7_9CHLO|nr:hypothetical protein CYMTET_9848 [Cymbomonas tetramitiformis]